MVSEKIAPGLRGQRETIVCEHNVASHVPRFSTPSMIQLMEQASVSAIEHLLGPAQTSVGFEVNIRHLAPSSIGARIVARAELTEVNRNRLTFSVEAYDGETKIGEGTHRRAVISTAGRG
jgi:predicted thioesterase